MIGISEFNAYTGKITALLRNLIELESPTHDKEAVDRLGDFVSAEVGRQGAQLTRERQTTAGDQWIAHWGALGGQKGILLLCHLDTVHPLGSLAKNPVRERNGKLFGPGALDMKGGVAILLTVLEILSEKGCWPRRPITALFTTDEETGSHTSRPLIERLAKNAELVLCLEPGLPDGSLKTWRKGVGRFELMVRGRAAHAGGDHEQGRNAIEEIANQVLAIQKLTDYRKGTTLNVGLIGGGTASNVVPDEAWAEIDLRVLSLAEAERVMREMRSLRPVIDGTQVEVRGELNRPPMPRDGQMQITFERAVQIASGLGLSLTEGGTGGGSDANFVALLGVPVLDGLGAVGVGLHSEREQVEIRSLPERAALLAALLTSW